MLIFENFRIGTCPKGEIANYNQNNKKISYFLLRFCSH